MKSLLLLFSLSLNLWATSLVEGLFETHFHDRYQSGRCGDNVRAFLQDLEKFGVNLTDFELVLLTNTGNSTFGMVNAELARTSTTFGMSAYEKNWYHHVFAVDSKGNVYDFDFGATPRVLKFETYIEEMFLNEEECRKPRSSEFCVGRDTKLNDYHLEIVSALDFLENRGEASWTGSLQEALEQTYGY